MIWNIMALFSLGDQYYHNSLSCLPVNHKNFLVSRRWTIKKVWWVGFGAGNHARPSPSFQVNRCRRPPPSSRWPTQSPCGCCGPQAGTATAPPPPAPRPGERVVRWNGAKEKECASGHAVWRPSNVSNYDAVAILNLFFNSVLLMRICIPFDYPSPF